MNQIEKVPSKPPRGGWEEEKERKLGGYVVFGGRGG